MAHMGTMISWKTKDGLSFDAYVAGREDAPGIVLIHEWWGLNHGTKEIADELSKLGFRGAAIDLYDGTVTNDRLEAGALMQGLDKKAAGAKVDAAVIALGAGGRKVGTIGWCMGGGFALRAALSQPSKVAAAVVYYGEVIGDAAALAPLTAPVLGVFAEKDGWITAAMANGFRAALEQAGKSHVVKIFPADHAFANPASANHDPKCAAEAWKMTTDFLAKNLI